VAFIMRVGQMMQDDTIQLTLSLVSWVSIQGHRRPPPDVFSFWEKHGEPSTYQTSLALPDVGGLVSPSAACQEVPSRAMART